MRLVDLQAATLRLIARLTEELKAEHTKELAAIDEATRTHLSIGSSYWERRLRAERKLRAAYSLLTSLEEPVA